MKAVNLIPAEQQAGGGPAAGESNGAAFMVLGLLAGLAVLAGLYGIASHQVESRKGEVTNLTAQAQAMQARAAELAPYVAFKGMYQQRLQAVNQLVGTRFDWAHAFHELGRVMPSGTALNSVHGTIAAAGAAGGASASSSTPAATGTSASSSTPAAAGTVASATPPGTVPTFVLAGCASTQSTVAQTLQRLRLMDGVSGVTLQSSTKGSGSGGSGGCPLKDPAFAVTVTFTGLPTPAAPSAAASGSTATPAATPTSTTPAAATPVANTKGAQ